MFNVQGFAMGNGFTNPEIQYAAYTDFALQNGLITSNDYHRINLGLPLCLQFIEACGIIIFALNYLFLLLYFSF